MMLNKSFTYRIRRLISRSMFVIGLLSLTYLSHGFVYTGGTSNLTVRIVNMQNKKGVVEIGLYSESDPFPTPGKTMKMARVKAEMKEVRHTFKNIPKGNYAIAIYHDENNDKKCNKNFFGVPTEAYCFSNNFRPMFSVPKFHNCKFSVQKSKIVSIVMIY